MREAGWIQINNVIFRQIIMKYLLVVAHPDDEVRGWCIDVEMVA